MKVLIFFVSKNKSLCSTASLRSLSISCTSSQLSPCVPQDLRLWIQNTVEFVNCLLIFLLTIQLGDSNVSLHTLLNVSIHRATAAIPTSGWSFQPYLPNRTARRPSVLPNCLRQDLRKQKNWQQRIRRIKLGEISCQSLRLQKKSGNLGPIFWTFIPCLVVELSSLLHLFLPWTWGNYLPSKDR